MTPNDSIYHSINDHSLVGPYVIDALTDDERDEFEGHLSTCARCQREVAEFGESLADLSAELMAPPPANLRGSILAAIKEVPQEAPLPAEPAVPDEERVTDERPALSVISTRDADVPATGPGSPGWQLPAEQRAVDELALRRSRRLSRALFAAVAAVAVVALALGGVAYNLNQQRQREIAASQQTQQQAAAERQRQTDLLAAPDAKVFTQEKDGARYSFVVSKTRNEALFLGTNLPNPGTGRMYQLWTLSGTAPTPAVDSSVQGSGSVRQWFKGNVEGSGALAVNTEPLSGPPAPNQPSGEILAAVTI